METYICWFSILNLKETKVAKDCIIADEFNVTIPISEKRGEIIVWDPLREKMEELIVYWDLLDIKPIKGRYTWTKKRSELGHIATILDIILVHRNFLMQD